MPKQIDTAEIAKKYTPVFETRFDACVISMSYSFDNRLLCSSPVDGDTLIHEAQTGKKISALPGAAAGTFWNNTNPVRNLLAIGYDNKKAAIYSLDDFSKVQDLDHAGAWVEHGAWSACGEYLATSAAKKVYIWKSDGTLIFTSPEHGGTIAGLDWNHGKPELAVASYGGISLWDISDLASMTPLSYKGSLLTIRWSPSGKWIASGNQDSSLHIWPIKQKVEDLHMSGYAVKIQSIAWNPQSRYLASANLNNVTIWDFKGTGPSGSTPEMFETVAGQIATMAYHPKEPLLLAVGTSAGHIELYSQSIKNFVAIRALDDDPLQSMAWSPDGKQIAAGGERGSLRVWNVNLTK